MNEFEIVKEILKNLALEEEDTTIDKMTLQQLKEEGIVDDYEEYKELLNLGWNCNDVD